ncbi:low-density lipoprotein receptor-related protein 6-like [Copidosoma floridanum]|uniref:low-density lipoprotein receptor-related protein 6-like n=1 Tax=Copidosoma floridanum TaxID=29053 RepID=UPI0006C93D33|nr:low-density lipoprotein receptor-related protein 6-like [Copidosoma floridanum]
MDTDERWDNVNVLTNSDGDLEINNSIHDTDGSKAFGIKSYIPKRSSQKYLRPIYIASGIAAFIIIVIIIITVSVTGSNRGKGTDSSGLLPHGLILHNNDSFWSYDIKNDKAAFLFNVASINYFDVFSRKMIILSATDASKIISLSHKNSNPIQKNTSFIFEERRIKPQGIAIDFITGNIYVVDEISELVVVINPQSKNYNILLSDLKKPREIVLDPVQGLMFICQVSDSILKGNMDGTSLKKIVQNSEISAITLDRKTRRVYWVQDFISIESSDYEGNDRKLFFADSVVIVSLAILDNQFFWLWPNYGHINATLWSCQLHNDTCEEHVMHKLDSFHNAKHIKPSMYQNEDSPNLCKVNNGGCEHLCLTTRDGGRSCACKLGWQLNPDRKTCRLVTDFIIYVVDDLIRGRIVDNTKTALIDVFWPTLYSVESVKTKGTIDFDYDLTNDNFYFSDDVQICQIKLRSQSNQTVLMQNELFYTIEDLAYDWLTGNMYYSLRSKLHSRRHYLMMFNVDRGSEHKKVIANFLYDSVFGLQACPYALALYPTKGFLFYTAGEDTQRSIQRMTMNGTKLTQIFQIPYVHEHRLITLDYEKDKVYWIYSTEDSFTKVKYADFDGNNEKIIVIDSMRMARTISVHHQWLYVSNDSSIWRVHKETGLGLVRIIPTYEDDRGKIVGARIISSSVQATGLENNPCAINNGGCERFCFAAPKKTCD